MIIRLLEEHDRIHVKNIMLTHSLQFPNFIIDQYHLRWADFLDKPIDNACGFYVAEEHIILGHAGYIFNIEKGIYEIVGVVVHKQYQRKGIGITLLDTICNKVRLLGGDKVMLSTLGHEGNQDTLNFYHNTGYEEISFERDYYTKDYHKVTFEKNLNIV